MRAVLVAFATAAVAGGCTLHRAAGTGDVAFRLAWSGESDLDLFVQDPRGDCVFFFDRESPSGGILDVDCNATADALCADPVENVYWPSGLAPAGEYLFWVEAHSLRPGEAPVGFQIQILRGDSVVWVERARAVRQGEVHGPYRLEWRQGRLAGSISAVRLSPPDCFARLRRATP